MKAAIVEYPVIIDGNRSTIKLDPATTMFDDEVVEMTELTIVSSQGPSTLGGVYRALDNAYGSSISARFSGGVPYTISTSGATAQQYAVLDPKNPANCSIYSKDPSQDLLQAIRDLMFRTAIAAANETANRSDRQTVRAQQTSSESAYESHYLFLGLATLFTALAWLAKLPIFIGWWSVGRKTSMSPIETAKAFGAPMLEIADPNATADMLLKEVGDRAVRYGSVAVSRSQIDRIAMSEPHIVRTPYKGQTFSS